MAHALNGDRSRTRPRPQPRRAAVSIVSNTVLIALKVVAGVLTGSVAILTEALHSGIDLLAASSPSSPSAAPRSRPTPATATATRSSRTPPRRPRAC